MQTRLLVISLFLCSALYAQPATTQSTGFEADSLSDIIQLTSGFDRAGEAYFSADMQWIIFQATPKGEKQYHMYVAAVKQEGGNISGIDTPIRISPANSRNTCGSF